MRKRTIQYMIDEETGLVFSRVRSEIAIPVLQFDKMVPENNFANVWELEKMSVYDTIGMSLLHTRKIPIEIKNEHRKFWGMKPLK